VNSVLSGAMSQRYAADFYSIPRSTIKLKVRHAATKGRVPVEKGKPGHPTVFSVEEEKEFCEYVTKMSEFGYPIDTYDLQVIISSYLGRTGRKVAAFKNNIPGSDWTRSFIKRHNELTTRFASNIKRVRAGITEETINEYFENLTKELNDVPTSNTWNFDETNLTDDPGQKRVLTKRGTKYPERIMNSSKSAISLMFCGNADGEVLPPYVVYKAEALWTTWTEGGPKGARYNRTKSGWFDAVTFEDWFMSLFLPCLRKQEGQKVVISDNLSSHINLNILRVCEQNNIRFIALPPNSTHLTQPLDVAYFRPMKIAWRKVMSEWKTSAQGKCASTINKSKFPQLLDQLMTSLQENGADNLKSGFRKTGISPINKQEVLDRLPDYRKHRHEHEVVSQSFIDFLTDKRAIDTPSGQPKRRKKVNVQPGKSISVADVEPASTSSTGVSTQSATGTGTDTAVTTGRRHGRKQQVPVPQTLDMTSSTGTSIGTGSDSSNDDHDGDSDSESMTGMYSADENNNVASTGNRQNVASDESTVVIPVLGEYVLVEYDATLYPGRVVSVAETTPLVTVSCMERSKIFWKWPAKEDVLMYSFASIKRKIAVPEMVSARGLYRVPELL
jgi:hypothetical protein